jgi:hypothetical protein
MNHIVNKILSAYVHLRYQHVEKHLRYFIRDTIYCQLLQNKLLLKDVVFKKQYKSLSFHGEFGPELLFVLPFAYWHFKNGTLKETESCSQTAELYYFSPSHKETFGVRSNEGNYNFEMPRILYSHNYNIKKWAAVPLKETYKNLTYVFEKPILIVANRYNSEWGGPPISFLSIETLKFIFDNLKASYTIIYNRPESGHITMDNSEIYELNEKEWIKESYPEVILMSDLYRENRGKARNFNHLQLMIYANSENFISTHGGTSILASYFKGTNIIFSKEGPEHVFDCFTKFYPKLSGARVLHAKTDEELKGLIVRNFTTKTPRLNRSSR